VDADSPLYLGLACTSPGKPEWRQAYGCEEHDERDGPTVEHHPGKCTEQQERDDDAFDDARPHRGNVSRCWVHSQETPAANVGPLEPGVVLIIVLVVFGPKRLPELGRLLAHGIREFKGSLAGEEQSDGPSPETGSAWRSG
jgi:TatA/E family protein of Tat protein translocase